MNPPRPESLREVLVRRYDDLKRRLTLRLGNPDLAGDALHETWLRLDGDGAPQEAAVQHPLSYLMRMATNAAVDRVRAEARFLSGAEVDALFATLSDPQPGPARDAEMACQVATIADIIREMPPRRQRILMMLRVDELPRQEVADRLRVSLSLVDRELRRAHEYIAQRMGEGGGDHD